MNNAVELIASGLTNGQALTPCNGVCAFTGVPITEGVRLKDALSGNFSDTDYIRFRSAYVCEALAKCIRPLDASGKSSLRNYSFLATTGHLRLLKSENLYAALTQPKPSPFVLAVSYRNKKHLSYKCRPQYDNDTFTVFTDDGEVLFHRPTFDKVYDIARRWYSIVPGKAGAAQPPTYFTKEEIATGIVPQHKIAQYGVRFFEENSVLEAYRLDPILKLITVTLKKDCQ